jgi:hypothetical protein
MVAEERLKAMVNIAIPVSMRDKAASPEWV